MKKETES